MTSTDNYGLNLPELGDQYNLEHWNENTRKIDEQMKANEDKINTKATTASLNSHTEATTGVHGATSAPTANKIAIRDSAGRLQVTTPSTANDVANKEYVDVASGEAMPGSSGTLIKYTTSGNKSITPGWYLVELWGGGGGGGGGVQAIFPQNVGNNGGCGGAYRAIFMYIRANSINVEIGHGGEGRNPTYPLRGGNGGDTVVTIGSLKLVAGGGRGGDQYNGSDRGAGASGGAGGYYFNIEGSLPIKLNGDDGAKSVIGKNGGLGGETKEDIYGGGGGGGGYEEGGDGGTKDSPNGKNGGLGAGGGGCCSGNGDFVGGNGGKGIVILTPFNA